MGVEPASCGRDHDGVGLETFQQIHVELGQVEFVLMFPLGRQQAGDQRGHFVVAGAATEEVVHRRVPG